MPEETPTIQILFSDEFKARLRALAKRYRSIRKDLQLLIDELQSGNFVGDRIPGTGYTVFKVRLKNSDIQKGKSAGYRVIYQLRGNTCIFLILIYSKSDHVTQNHYNFPEPKQAEATQTVADLLQDIRSRYPQATDAEILEIIDRGLATMQQNNLLTIVRIAICAVLRLNG